MRFVMYFGAAITAIALFTMAVAPESRTCTGNPDIDWDTQISSCTALIQSSQETTHNRAAAYNNRGAAWYAKGDDEAIRLDPKDALAFRNRGLAYAAKGDRDRAIADYSEAIRLDPKYALAYNNRANTYATKGDKDRAIADFNEAIRLDPKDAGAFIYDPPGIAWYAKGYNDRAIADYNEAIRLDQKYAMAYNNRGYVWYTKGDNDRAIADYSEAIRLDPKYAQALHNRGLVFFYNGDFEKAAADLLRFNDLKKNVYAMLWRYLALGHMGQDGAAELSANATRLSTEDWPHAVIDFYLGRRSLDEMRTAGASNAKDECESAFYAGEWQLLRGNKAEAKASLQIAADTCARTSVEYPGAISELTRLDQ